MLTAYSYRDMQMFGQFLDIAMEDGKDISSLRAEVAVAQEGMLASVANAVKLQSDNGGYRICPTVRPDSSRCPGRLLPVRNPDGLAVFGCPVCRYSEVR